MSCELNTLFYICLTIVSVFSQNLLVGKFGLKPSRGAGKVQPRQIRSTGNVPIHVKPHEQSELGISDRGQSSPSFHCQIPICNFILKATFLSSLILSEITSLKNVSQNYVGYLDHFGPECKGKPAVPTPSLSHRASH